MIGIYIRVSSQEQKKGRSIESQLHELQKYAKDENLSIHKIYEDNGWSGGVLERPQLDQLRKDVKARLIDKIIMLHPDRMSRVQLHQFLLFDEFEKNGAEIVFTSQPDQGGQSKETKLVMRTVLGLAAELERLRIKDRVRVSRQNWAEKGFVMTSRSPYGFKYVEGDRRKGLKGYFVHNTQEIEVVKKIIQWAKDGVSLNGIVKLLKEENIPTRTGNTTWAKSSVSKILGVNLSAYAGTWNYGKYRMTEPVKSRNKSRYRTMKSSRRLNDKSEWTSVKLSKDLAIITQQDVDQIRENQTRNKVVKKHTSNKYLLRGRVFCDKCHGLNYSDSYHGIGYYRCANKKRNFPNPATCVGGSIKAEKIEKVVWDRLKSFITNKELLQEEARKYIERKGDRNDGNLTELKTVQKEIKKIADEKYNLAGAYIKGLIDDESMAKHNLRLHGDLRVLKAKEVKLSQEAEKYIDREQLLENLTELVQGTSDLIKNLKYEEKEKVMEWLKVEVFIHKDSYRIKGNLALNVESCPQHIHNIDSFQPSDSYLPFELTGSL